MSEAEADMNWLRSANVGAGPRVSGAAAAAAPVGAFRFLLCGAAAAGAAAGWLTGAALAAGGAANGSGPVTPWVSLTLETSRSRSASIASPSRRSLALRRLWVDTNEPK